MQQRATRPRTDAHSSRPQGAGESGGWLRWLRLLGGVLAILLFAFVAIPALQRLQTVREVREAVRNSGIDATALFYTESDVSSEAEAAIRNATRYAPGPRVRPR